MSWTERCKELDLGGEINEMEIKSFVLDPPKAKGAPKQEMRRLSVERLTLTLSNLIVQR